MKDKVIKAMGSSGDGEGSVEWETPQCVFEEISKFFGGLDLDPCATAENAKCDKYFTERVDGLIQPWTLHHAFMNPPYGRIIGEWIKKAYDESRRNYTIVVCLIPARTDTNWWHNYVMKANEIWFVNKRVKFIRDDGKTGPPLFPNAIVLFEKDLEPGEYPAIGSVKFIYNRARTSCTAVWRSGRTHSA